MNAKSTDDGPGIRAGQRDRTLDLVRAGAMACVVLNHYFFTMAWGTNGDGHWRFVQREGQPWVTWPFVFELVTFFFVGGATTYHSAIRTPAVEFLKKRCWRLLVPVPFVIASALVLELIIRKGTSLGVCRDGLDLPFFPTCPTAIVLSPLWFVLVYLPLTAISPILVRVWQTPWKWLLLSAAIVIAMASDIQRYQGSSGIGFNQMTVYLVPWLAGFAYADGSMFRVPRSTLLATSAASVALMASLMITDFYPAEIGHPIRSVLSILETTIAIPLIVVGRDRLSGIAETRGGRWLVTTVGNRMMTLFVWHMLAYALVLTMALLLGVEFASEPGVEFWLQRIPMFVATLAVLVPLVRLVEPLERIPVPVWLLRIHRDA